MFVLTPEEFTTLRSQFVTSKTDPRGGVQYSPMAFTEQGVAMLSGILNSDRARATLEVGERLRYYGCRSHDDRLWVRRR